MNKCAGLFTAFLDSKKFTYDVHELNNGDMLVNFPYDGKSVNCVFSGNEGTYFSLYLNYEKVPENKIADAIFLCNELNIKYKWITFFVDNDGNFMFHDDAILSAATAADEAFELLVRTINIRDEVKPSIMRMLYV